MQPRLALPVFVLFCCLSATRDVLSEVFLKKQEYQLSPVFILLIYSLTTQLIFGLHLLVRPRRVRTSNTLASRDTVLALALLNVFTVIAYTTYFLAIASPLGAGLNSFVDYGTTPLFTAITGALLLGEKLNKRFWYSATLGLSGVFLFSISRISSDLSMSFAWLLGLTYALVSSLSSAAYRVYSKQLLSVGMDKSQILFYRLFGVTISLSVYAYIGKEVVQVEAILPVLITGIIGFSLPLFLILYVLEHMEIRQFAILWFLLPLITYFVSFGFGYTDVYVLDALAAICIVLGVSSYEFAYERSPK